MIREATESIDRGAIIGGMIGATGEAGRFGRAGDVFPNFLGGGSSAAEAVDGEESTMSGKEDELAKNGELTVAGELDGVVCEETDPSLARPA